MKCKRCEKPIDKNDIYVEHPKQWPPDFYHFACALQEETLMVILEGVRV